VSNSKKRTQDLAARLLAYLEHFKSRTILVAGDLIADEFLYGQIARVSREAPVLVLEHRQLVRLPGGGANAASNLLDLGCRVKLIAAVGPDDAGKNLVRMLTQKGADVDDILVVSSYETPVKTRILAGAHHSAPQQIVRVDRIPKPRTTVALPLKRLSSSQVSPDAIIVSDYGYGAISSQFLDRLKGYATARKIPMMVDSRFRMAEFRQVTGITPNITELEAAVRRSIGADEPLLRRVGQSVLRKQGLTYLLVTQGRFGMTLFQRNRIPLHIPIFGSDEVADVTGAGDTVIAVFTLALACGATAEEAARLANYAGGVVVMKRGTATVTPEELSSAIRKDLL
jgi:rfaE bifunctional protein kinase chain/domain